MLGCNLQTFQLSKIFIVRTWWILGLLYIIKGWWDNSSISLLQGHLLQLMLLVSLSRGLIIVIVRQQWASFSIFKDLKWKAYQEHGELNINIFNADFVGLSIAGISTTRFYFADNFIMWKSKKKAKWGRMNYCWSRTVMAHATCELLWIKSFHEDLGFNIPSWLQAIQTPNTMISMSKRISAPYTSLEEHFYLAYCYYSLYIFI